MRVMVLVKATEDSERGTLPTAELLERVGKFNAELRAAGILRAADGLKPSSHGKRISLNEAVARSSIGDSAMSKNWLPASGSGRSKTWTKL